MHGPLNVKYRWCQAFVNTVMSLRLTYIAVNWPTSWTPLIISSLTLLHSFFIYHHSWLWIILIITIIIITPARRIIFTIIPVTYSINVSKLRYLWATISCCANINLLSSLLSIIPCGRNVSTVWSFVQIASSVKRRTYTRLSRRLFYATKNYHFVVSLQPISLVWQDHHLVPLPDLPMRQEPITFWSLL